MLRRARKYNKKISVYQTTQVSDTFGGYTTSETLVTTLWCYMTTMSANSKFNLGSDSLGSIDFANSIRLIFRYNPNFTFNYKNMYFMYRGFRYTIQNNTININYANSEVEVYATRENNLIATPADTTAPTVPSNVIVGTITETTAVVTWDASTDASGGTILYEVYVDDVSVGITSVLYFELRGLSEATSYNVSLTAADRFNNTSAKSTPVTFSTQSGLDADYQAVLDYATTQGYSLPSAGQQVLQNDLVVSLKSANVWNKLDFFGVLATENADFGLIDWIRLSTNTAVNSPTFTTNVGYQGNGTSSYIDLNYNPSVDATNFLLNNHTFGGYNQNATAQQGAFISSFGSVYCEISNDNPLSKFIVFDCSPIARTPNVGANNQNGHLMIDRNNASSFEFYKDNVNQPITATVSNALPNANFRLFARTNNSFYGDGQASYYFGGASLTATERADFISAINTYLTLI